MYRALLLAAIILPSAPHAQEEKLTFVCTMVERQMMFDGERDFVIRLDEQRPEVIDLARGPDLLSYENDGTTIRYSRRWFDADKPESDSENTGVLFVSFSREDMILKSAGSGFRDGKVFSTTFKFNCIEMP